MKHALLAGAILLISGATMARGQSPTPTMPHLAIFAIQLQSRPTGWSARCDSGCRWTSVSFTCERRCGAIVDENGIVTNATLRTDSTAFMFIVDRTDSIVNAVARRGTAWATLSWGCREETCRASIDQLGVGGSPVRSFRHSP
jgi:hypothetical protein